MRRAVAYLMLVLPRRLRTLVARRVLGWDIHPTAYLGRSVIMVGHLKMGPLSVIGPRNVIRGLDELVLGNTAIIAERNQITGWPPAQFLEAFTERKSAFYLGDFAQVTIDHRIDCSDTVVLEHHAVIGGFGVTLLTHSLDVRTNGWMIEPLRIGHHTMILNGCTVLVGCDIAAQSFVGAGSVVTRPLAEPATMYRGNPAVAEKKLDLADYDVLTRSGQWGEGYSHPPKKKERLPLP